MINTYNLPELLTLKEAAEVLKCHPNTLRLWDKDGTLPMIRFGKRKTIRYNKDDIVTLLDKQKYNSSAKQTSVNLIQKLISKKSSRIYDRSVFLHKFIRQSSSIKTEKKSKYKALQIKVLKEICKHLDSLQTGIPVFIDYGKKMAYTALQIDLSIEQVMDSIIFLKRAIIEQSEQELFKHLTAKDVMVIGYTMNTFYDVLISSIASVYQMEYKKRSDSYIAEQKRAESELQYNLQLTRNITESTATIIFVSGKDGNINFINPEAEKVFGYKLHELSGKSLHEIIHYKHPDGRPFPIEECPLGNVYADGRAVRNFDTVFYKRDGSPVAVICSNMPIIENGKVAGEVLTMQDITKHKQIEEKLQTNLTMLNAIITGTNDAVFVKNIQGQYLIVNPGAASILGKNIDDIVGKNDCDLVPPEYVKAVQKTDRHIIKTGKSEIFEELMSIGPKVKTFLTTKSPLRDAKGNVIGIIGVSRDISDRKELEIRKDDFISMASHELKTPITSIKAYAQILEKSRTLSPTKRTLYLQKMNKQIDRLTELVTELLDISKIENGKIIYKQEKFDVDELVKETVDMIQQTLTKHTIHMRGKTHAHITADRDRISQVIINLLTNAVKYSPDATKVLLTVGSDDQKITIKVRDFGIGIAKKDQHKIYNRFYRVSGVANRQFPGLGVGLYISHQIVKRHAGTLGIQSKIGKGTTFILTLPRHRKT